MGWFWRRDRITKHLHIIRAANGTVLLDDEDLTTDPNVKKAAAKIWALADFVEPDFWVEVRHTLGEAARESKLRGEMNARGHETHKTPAHPYILIDVDRMNVLSEYHRCNSRTCCAD